MSNNIGERIKRLREKRGLTQEELSEIIELNRVTLAKYETGKYEPGSSVLQRLSKAFGVSVDYLLNGISADEANPARIAVYGDIRAGIPLNAVEDIEDWEEIDPSMLSCGREYFALRVKGDSMYPSYKNGDVLIIRKQDTCENGDDCAVMINGDDATFKRVRVSENGITLLPLNVDKYEPMFFTNKQAEELPVRILGVVVELRRKISR